MLNAPSISRAVALAQLRVWALLVTISSCIPRPANEPIVDRVAFDGVDRVDEGELEQQLSTRQTPSLLGVRGLVYEWERFNQHVLDRDLHRIERFYKSKGFHLARVKTGRVVRTDDEVTVNIEVDEGPQTRVRRVVLHGVRNRASDAVLSEVGKRLTEHVQVGEGYEEARVEKGRDAVIEALRNRGYAFADAKLDVRVDLPRQQALVAVACELGPLVRAANVKFVGADDLPEDVLRDAVGIRRGDVVSAKQLQVAERDLMNLGVFTSVGLELDQQPLSSEAPEPKGGAAIAARRASGTQTIYSDITVRLQRAKLRSLTLGGGLEADVIKTNVNLNATWRDQNFAGGLRDFSTTITPGVALYPTRVPSFRAPERLLPRAETNVNFSQPRPLGTKTRLVSSAEYLIYPVLLNPNPPDRAPIVGYHELRAKAGVERRFRQFSLTPSYNFQAGVPFTYVGDLSESATSVYISFAEILAELDYRNDKSVPTRGLYTALRTQFAGIGGSARDIRIEPEVRTYVPLTSGRTVFASRLKFGFLEPFNYQTPGEGNSVSVADSQISYFRSFFSGGPMSNRGYPYRGVGPTGNLEFFYPAATASALNACDTTDKSSNCTVPLGGTTVWEFGLELRFRIWEALSNAFFCDMSDVGQKLEFESFLRPHMACGWGPRYDTPVGPIRLDVAYRLPGLQNRTDRAEVTPGNLLGLPINISFGIGEAF